MEKVKLVHGHLNTIKFGQLMVFTMFKKKRNNDRF